MLLFVHYLYGQMLRFMPTKSDKSAALEPAETSRPKGCIRQSVKAKKEYDLIENVVLETLKKRSGKFANTSTPDNRTISSPNCCTYILKHKKKHALPVF